MRVVLPLLLCLLFLSACGRKGALMPPEALVPAAVQDLSVLQSGEDFRIVWSAPTKEKGGRPLRDLAEFRLLRRSIAGDGSDCSSCTDSWKLLTTVALDVPGEAVKYGETFIYRDKGLAPGSSSQYRLLAISRSGGISAPAISPVKKLQPVTTPPALKAQLAPAAIRLEFGAVGAGTAKLLGFNIYRRKIGENSAALPQNAVPINKNYWEDHELELGQTYRYRATAVVEREGETVESPLSAEIELLYSLQELR